MATHVPLVSFQVLKIEPVVVEHELSEDGRAMRGAFAGGQMERPDIAEHFASLCRAIEGTDPEPFERRALLREFLFAAFSGDDSQPYKAQIVCCERAVKRVREILRSRYDESLTLEYLEDETGVSKYHLERSFRAKIGVPIHRYLKLVRLGKAQELLRRGHRAIDVAHATGFFDSAHMSRVFTAELGIAPGAYARTALRAARPARPPIPVG